MFASPELNARVLGTSSRLLTEANLVSVWVDLIWKCQPPVNMILSVSLHCLNKLVAIAPFHLCNLVTWHWPKSVGSEKIKVIRVFKVKKKNTGQTKGPPPCFSPIAA